MMDGLAFPPVIFGILVISYCTQGSTSHFGTQRRRDRSVRTLVNVVLVESFYSMSWYRSDTYLSSHSIYIRNLREEVGRSEYT